MQIVVGLVVSRTAVFYTLWPGESEGVETVETFSFVLNFNLGANTSTLGIRLVTLMKLISMGCDCPSPSPRTCISYKETQNPGLRLQKQEQAGANAGCNLPMLPFLLGVSCFCYILNGLLQMSFFCHRLCYFIVPFGRIWSFFKMYIWHCSRKAWIRKLEPIQSLFRKHGLLLGIISAWTISRPSHLWDRENV